MHKKILIKKVDSITIHLISLFADRTVLYPKRSL